MRLLPTPTVRWVTAVLLVTSVQLLVYSSRTYRQTAPSVASSRFRNANLKILVLDIVTLTVAMSAAALRSWRVTEVDVKRASTR